MKRSWRHPALGLVTIFISVLVTAAPAWGQVPDPIFTDPTDPGYAGPVPTTSGTITTATVASTNESADTLQYGDRELGPINVGFDLKGGYGDNLFNSPGGGSRGGVFAGFGVPVGLRFRNVKTDFNLNYRIDKVFYPNFSQVDNLSQILSTQVDRRTSEHTTLFGNFAAGRVTSIGQYLPVIIPIGSGGVAQGPTGASIANGSSTTSNLAASFGFSHDLNEHDKVLGTVTAGWLEQAEGNASPGTPRQILRNEVAGLDLQFARAINLKDTLGVELTNTYIRGQEPKGHANFIAAQATYGRQLSNHINFRVSAGPLYSAVSGVAVPHDNSFNYAASADIEYRIQHTRMGLGYSRVFQAGYQQTAAIANQFSGTFDRELSSTVDLTVDTRYVRTDSSSALLNQSTFGVEGRVNKRIAPNVLLFVSASRSQQTQPGVLVNNNSYGRDDVFGGITVLLGNPIYRRGAQ